jgi:hypothetical protein
MLRFSYVLCTSLPVRVLWSSFSTRQQMPFPSCLKGRISVHLPEACRITFLSIQYIGRFQSLSFFCFVAAVPKSSFFWPRFVPQCDIDPTSPIRHRHGLSLAREATSRPTRQKTKRWCVSLVNNAGWVVSWDRRGDQVTIDGGVCVFSALLISALCTAS